MTEAAVRVPYHVSGGLPFVDRQTFLGMIGQASEQVQLAEEAARDLAAIVAHAAAIQNLIARNPDFLPDFVKQ